MKIRDDGDGYFLKFRQDGAWGKWANYDEQNGPFVSLYDLLNYFICGSERPDDIRKALGIPAASASSANKSATANANDSVEGSTVTRTRLQPKRLYLSESGVFLDLLCPFVDVVDPTAERWFHGPITSKEANLLLASKPFSSSAYQHVV